MLGFFEVSAVSLRGVKVILSLVETLPLSRPERVFRGSLGINWRVFGLRLRLGPRGIWYLNTLLSCGNE